MVTCENFIFNFRSRLYGGDLEAASGILSTVTNRLQFALQNAGPGDEAVLEARVQEAFQNVLRSVSNVLSASQEKAWLDLREARQIKVATSMLLSLERHAFLLAHVVRGRNDRRVDDVKEASKEICE